MTEPELRAEIARLTECLAVADADRVPLAMDLESLRAVHAQQESALHEVQVWLLDLGADNTQAGPMNNDAGAATMLEHVEEALGWPRCEACTRAMAPGTYHTDEESVSWHRRDEDCAPECRPEEA